MPRGRQCTVASWRTWLFGSQRGLSWQLWLKPSLGHSLRCAVLCAVPSVVSDFVDPVDCCPPGKNTGVGRHALLQEIFPARGWNPSLCRLHWQAGSLASALPGQLLPPCFTPSPHLNSPGALLVHSLTPFLCPFHVVSWQQTPRLYQEPGNLAQGTHAAMLFPSFLLLFFVIPPSFFPVCFVAVCCF